MISPVFRFPENIGAFGLFVLEIRRTDRVGLRQSAETRGQHIALLRCDVQASYHLLQRGSVEAPGELMQPGAVTAVAGLESRWPLDSAAGEGQRRAALAKWLTAPSNPLTWRSIGHGLTPMASVALEQQGPRAGLRRRGGGCDARRRAAEHDDFGLGDHRRAARRLLDEIHAQRSSSG